jgi:superfamily II DNA or RNA helicase
MGTTARAAATARLVATTHGPPLLVVATGPYVGEGFDCPALDTLFLTTPIAFKGQLVQYVGRILRPSPDKDTAEVHDYHNIATEVLASPLAKRAAGYTSLGFPRSLARARPGRVHWAHLPSSTDNRSSHRRRGTGRTPPVGLSRSRTVDGADASPAPALSPPAPTAIAATPRQPPPATTPSEPSATTPSPHRTRGS